MASWRQQPQVEKASHSACHACPVIKGRAATVGNFELGNSRPHTICYVLFPAGVWKLLTCQDLFVAGIGSPRTAVLPAGVINAASNQGHNKRIALLPQGFSWAATTTTFNQPLPTCVASWASWVGNTPYGRFFSDSR